MDFKQICSIKLLFECHGRKFLADIFSETQCLFPALTIQIKIRRFSQRTHPIASPSSLIIISCAMPIAPIIPNSKIILIPLEPDLGIMILRDKIY